VGPIKEWIFPKMARGQDHQTIRTWRNPALLMSAPKKVNVLSYEKFVRERQQSSHKKPKKSLVRKDLMRILVVLQAAQKLQGHPETGKTQTTAARFRNHGC
jgi:hypothetical protein